MGLRAKIIWFMVAIVFSPIIVSMIVLFGFLSNLFSDTENQVNEIEESFYQIEQKLYENFSLIENEKALYRKLEPFLEENQLNIKIENLEGEILFNSKHFMETEEFEGIRKIVQSFNQYTISIIQDNKKVANATIQATPLSPPEYTVNSNFFFSIFVSFTTGLITFIVLMILFSLYISKHILTPIEKLDLAMQYVSEGDYSFDLKVKAKSEMGRLTVSFKEMREKLQLALEKQEAYEKGRKELIASISHDLRTPLASIRGYVEGLKDGVAEDEEQREKYLSIIQYKSQQLNRLIEDLFEFSKIELDQLQMNLVEMDSVWLDEIFNQIAFDGKQMKMNLEIDYDIHSVPLLIDPDRIAQVLINLIQNAKRYINEETGKVWIETEQEGSWFVIQVKDNGKGISEKDLPHIFDRFYRVEKSRSRQYGGTGLGLTICKAIMEAHNGKIEVNSKEGVGTIFSLYLPVQSL